MSLDRDALATPEPGSAEASIAKPLQGFRLVTSALEKKAVTTTQVEVLHRNLTRQRRRDNHD